MAFRVLHHDRCFDGACSAAVFTKFHRECVGGADGYEYKGLAHLPGGVFDEAVFGPGENAIVDFKYSTSPKLTWWFDHHQSAFVTPADRAAFEAGQSAEDGPVPKARREFFDPNYISCTNLIADVGKARFGFDASGLGELLKWADIVDGARYESAKSAVEMDAPAMKLTMVIENAADGFIPRVIPLLTEMPLQEVLDQGFVQEAVGPLWEKHVAAMALIRERAELRDGVIYFDITDQPTEGVSKFIPYYYYPEATYTIGLMRSSFRTKISVGTNPWTNRRGDELVNLAKICERFGGGGHARVGAISFGAAEIERGREVALGIAEELRAGERQR
jgi:hypothetical protein